METSPSSSSLSAAPSPDGPVPGEAAVFVSPTKKTHQRSKSDAAMMNSGPGAGLRRTGSNPKVEAVHEEVRTKLLPSHCLSQNRNTPLLESPDRPCP